MEATTDQVNEVTNSLQPGNSENVNFHSKNYYWNQVDKAYLLTHWVPGASNEAKEAQTTVAKHLGRTTLACYHTFTKLSSAKDQSKIKKGQHNFKMIGRNSLHLTPGEQNEILETFGGFTPDIKNLILSLRGYTDIKVQHLDKEKHMLLIHFYSPEEKAAK